MTAGTVVIGKIAMEYSPVDGWEESWLWYETSVNSCASDLYIHWPFAFSGWTLDYIMIHEHPNREHP